MIQLKAYFVSQSKKQSLDLVLAELLLECIILCLFWCETRSQMLYRMENLLTHCALKSQLHEHEPTRQPSAYRSVSLPLTYHRHVYGPQTV